MRRVRSLTAPHKKVSEHLPASAGAVPALTSAEARRLLAEAAALQAGTLQGLSLYWGEAENCLARLSKAAENSGKLGEAARAYAAYGERQRELRKDLLRVALRLAKANSDESRDRGEPDDCRDQDGSSWDGGLSLTGNLLLLFATLDSSDGSLRCHRVAVNAEDAVLTRETQNLPPMTKSQIKKILVQQKVQQKEMKRQKTAPCGEAPSTAGKEQLRAGNLSDSDKAQLATPCSRRTYTENTRLEGLGMSSCPSAEHMDAVTEGFKLGAVGVVELQAGHSDRPLVEQLAAARIAYRVGFSEAGQPDLASTNTATASTDGSAGDSGSDDKRSRPQQQQQQQQKQQQQQQQKQQQQQQSRSRTVSGRETAATSKAGQLTAKRQRRASEKPQPSPQSLTGKPSKASSSTALPGRKRLVLMKLEYQQDSKSATWRCPSSSIPRPVSESRTTKETKKKENERTDTAGTVASGETDPDRLPAVRQRKSSKPGSVCQVVELLPDADGSSKQARMRKSELRKSITQPTPVSDAATADRPTVPQAAPSSKLLKAASNSLAAGRSGSCRQKTATAESKKTRSSRS